MFRAAKMQKFRAVVLQRARDEVVSKLHEAGVVQLKEVSEVEVARRMLGDEFYEVSSTLARVKEIQRFLETPSYGRPVEVEELSYEQTLRLAKKLLSQLEPKVEALKAKGKWLVNRQQEISSQIAVLEDFRELRIPLQYLRSTDEIHVEMGRIAAEKTSEFLESVKDALSRRVVAAFLGKGRTRTLVVVCRTRDQPKLLPILYKYEVEPIELPPLKGLPREVLRALEKQLKELRKQAEELEKRKKKLARARASEVNCIAELLEIQRDRLSCDSLFGFTEATIVLEGWVPAKSMGELESTLAAATKRRYVLRTYEPQQVEVEKTPVRLENPGVIKDFEYITEMYGLPKYDEVDPTPILAFTFAIFFAICLSDAGYGIALALFLASNFWIARALPQELKRVMILCAASAVVVGFLMGGWFGDALANVHPFFRAHWVNPIEDPLPLLKLALLIGIAHLLIAFGLAGALKDIFRRDWGNLIFTRISRLLIMVGFFGLAFCVLGMSLTSVGIDFVFPKMDLFDAFNPLAPAQRLVLALRISFYLGLGIGVAGEALFKGGAAQRIGGSLNVIYGVVGMVADVISYARLMALGLATGVIAFLVNYIIKFFYQACFPSELSVASAILAVFLMAFLGFAFIVGHGFNIFINSLGGFVHTMRLHFAEFFGKFYEGGGSKFSPFKAKRTFTKLKGVSGW
jgi:V/A-type H+-transporting ATPase subunit I